MPLEGALIVGERDEEGLMSYRTATAGFALLSVTLGTVVLLGQSTLKAPNSVANSPEGIEFPVFMQQNVVAGKTPVGTTIKAKLAIATLVHGIVIPKDAILRGEVIESAAKSAAAPSRLSIRVDSVQWKKGSTPGELALSPKVYLTAWYYSVETPRPQDFPESGPPWRHAGATVSAPVDVTDASENAGHRYPRRDDDKNMEPARPAPPATVSQHRERIKNVESSRGADRSITLTSSRSNIKLDKSTMYVLATGALLPSSH